MPYEDTVISNLFMKLFHLAVHNAGLPLGFYAVLFSS